MASSLAFLACANVVTAYLQKVWIKLKCKKKHWGESYCMTDHLHSRTDKSLKSFERRPPPPPLRLVPSLPFLWWWGSACRLEDHGRNWQEQSTLEYVTNLQLPVNEIWCSLGIQSASLVAIETNIHISPKPYSQGYKTVTFTMCESVSNGHDLCDNLPICYANILDITMLPLIFRAFAMQNLLVRITKMTFLPLGSAK